MLEGDENETQNLEQTESTEQTSGEAAPETQEATQAQQELIDLDKVERFRFAGREWTPKDFQGAHMMQADYTRKTQALAEERKYYDNLQADLAAVKQNPSLAEKFRAIYPEKYHNFLEYAGLSQAQKQQAQAQQSNIDPAFLDRFNRLESTLKEREVQAIEAELDSKFKTLSVKYPLADEEAVLARAQALVDKGQSLNDKAWDSLWKSVNERNQKIAEKFYADKVNKQKLAHSKNKDVASGGGIPGQAPKMPKNLREASAMALQEIENS